MQMAMCLRVNDFKIKQKEREFIYIRMELAILENEKVINRMDLE